MTSAPVRECTCSAGYLHRDLKPANLLLTEEGVLKVGDLGQSRPHDAQPGTGRAAAYTAAVATRWYRAPELLLGSRSYGPAADMWAVGCILAEMLGEHPPSFAQGHLLARNIPVTMRSQPCCSLWPKRAAVAQPLAALARSTPCFCVTVPSSTHSLQQGYKNGTCLAGLVPLATCQP